MRIVLRGLVGIVALFNIAIGVGFLLAPARLGAAFFLSTIGTQGFATLRADFPGFFIAGGGFALMGAWRYRRAPLLVPVALIGIALVGRFVSLAVDGIGPAAIQPMAVEAVMLALLLAAYRQFDRSPR